MDSPKLKPCPHCGGSDLRVYWNDIYEKHYVRCHTCHMQGPEIYGREAAAEAWNAIPRALTWTTEKPTVLGWYWWKGYERDSAQLIEVFTAMIGGYSGLCVQIPRNGMQPIPSVGGFWAGPIPEPQEPRP